jgi:hypothetical protein
MGFKKLVPLVVVLVGLVGCTNRVAERGYRNGVITHRTSYGNIDMQQVFDYKHNMMIILLDDIVDGEPITYRVKVDMYTRSGSLSKLTGKFFNKTWSYPTIPAHHSSMSPLRYSKTVNGMEIALKNVRREVWWIIDVTDQQTYIKVYKIKDNYRRTADLVYSLSYENDTQYTGFKRIRHETIKSDYGIKWFVH